MSDFESYIDSVFRFALSLARDRHLAEDLTQECFLKAQRRIGQLRNRSATKAWLFQILANSWKDHVKKARNTIDEGVAIETVSVNRTAQQAAIEAEETNSVLGWMRSLPEKQRSVLYLSVVESLSNQSIADLLEISENNVKAHLSLARKAIRHKWVAYQKEDASELR